MQNLIGPQTEPGNLIHAMKYREVGEDFRETINRIAFGLRDSDEHYKAIREILLPMRFIPAGRVQNAIGSTRQTTPYNCFVSGTIEDSFTSGLGSIMDRAKEAAATMRMGGGIGYDFSTLRGRGAEIVGLGSHSSGPVEFMRIFNAICLATASSGHRRGAQMGVLRVDHPDIEEFIRAKQNTTELIGFNISVAVTDEFMEALAGGRNFWLRFNGRKVREVDSQLLWEKIMRSTWDWAEPGILFIDRINEWNNLHYCERISATNPCVPAETLLLTDKGQLPIGQFEGSQVNIWNGDKWSNVLVKRTGQNQPLMQISISNGTEIVCTPSHKFILRDGSRIEASELYFGAKLYKWQPPTIEGEIEEPLYTQGFFSGDGWIDARGRCYIGLYGDKIALCDKFEAKSTNVYDISGGYEGTDTTQKRMYLFFGYNVFRNKLFVPDASFNIKSRLSWLAGICDSDGCTTKGAGDNGTGIQLSSKSRDFLHEILLMLQTLGVSANLGAMKECWRLCINANAVAWLSTNGFKPNRLDISSNEPQREARRFPVVLEVRHLTRTADVFCFTEEKNHAGVFNGILTGQCGEQPLPPFGACLLGSYNLPRYVREDREFEFELLVEDTPHIVRAMDNVVDRARYPLAEQKAEAHSKRRMGLGVMGLANAAEAMGLPYGSEGFLAFEAKVLQTIRDETYRASAGLAREKGPFTLFDAPRYLQGKFIKTLPPQIQALIAKHGIRNSHLTSIAPTGTISLSADNVSSGIEPVFAYSTKRPINTPNGPEIFTIEDFGAKFFATRGKLAKDVTVKEHLDVLITAQKFVDSSVSKTINMTGKTPWEDFKGTYLGAYEGGAKGCTTFNSDGKRMTLLSESADEAIACRLDTETGQRDCS